MLAVAVSLKPEEFDCGPDPPDGGPGWELFGELYPQNPKMEVQDGDFEMVRLWSLYRPGMTGVGHLPDAGGTLDQPPIMLEAFDAMSHAAALLRKN